MRIAILTDIHANREALEACLSDAAAQAAERYVFLGDTVGYGADPAYSVDLVARYQAAGAIVLMGNHDWAVCHGSRSMNAGAAQAIDWTRDQLDKWQLAFLAGRPFFEREADRLFVHAEASSPKHWIYVTSAREALGSMSATRARVTFCGHVHVPQLYGRIRRKPPVAYSFEAENGFLLNGETQWLAVLGAVGQPRDGDPRACYGLFDAATSLLTLRRVPYDIAAAAAKIRAAGLPEILAGRLFRGL